MFISMHVGGKMLNFGMEAFFTLIFLNITTQIRDFTNQIFVASLLRYSIDHYIQKCALEKLIFSNKVPRKGTRCVQR